MPVIFEDIKMPSTATILGKAKTMRFRFLKVSATLVFISQIQKVQTVLVYTNIKDVKENRPTTCQDISLNFLLGCSCLLCKTISISNCLSAFFFSCNLSIFSTLIKASSISSVISDHQEYMLYFSAMFLLQL